jgi:hypothetical protein
MKKLSFILRLLLLATIASGQPFNASLVADELHITDASAPQPVPGFDAVMVEFTGISGCEYWHSGKLLPASSYTLPAPAFAASGLALRKSVWLGRLQNGTMRWQSQSGGCLALVLPAPQSDTTYLQSITVQVPSGTYSPDWYTPLVQGSALQLEATTAQPQGVQVQQLIVTSPAGYHMPNIDYLPAGFYFVTLVLEWQGMSFVETDQFYVF